MDQKSGKPSQKRRAILQGSLAAPVVLTVSSASATTMTSLGKCMANIGDQKPSEFFTNSENSDRWFRKQVDVVKLERGGGQNRESDWFFYDQQKSEYVRLSAPLVSTNIRQNLNGGWQQVDQSKRWGLWWVDSKTGSPYKMVTVQQPLGYQAVTCSCAASFTKTSRV
jgi:hypothetical protein